ncbi:hypothetical protein SAMD00019534_088720, partial [Acytostelium subglobosum LB1]|uniref:hypothetical protein n=1 Tax=Acytostelium subglobosum LB1 TaxID=1410327 RepID=UPI000644DED4
STPSMIVNHKRAYDMEDIEQPIKKKYKDDSRFTSVYDDKSKPITSTTTSSSGGVPSPQVFKFTGNNNYHNNNTRRVYFASDDEDEQEYDEIEDEDYDGSYSSNHRYTYIDDKHKAVLYPSCISNSSIASTTPTTTTTTTTAVQTIPTMNASSST